jgi:predicted secreted protein
LTRRDVDVVSAQVETEIEMARSACRWLVVAWLAGVVAGCASERRTAWGNVIVDDPENGTTVTVSAGQTLAVGLRSYGDGGYTPWALATPPDPSALRLLRTGNASIHGGGRPGDFGRDIFVFEAVGAGTTRIVETTSRPWDPSTLVTHTLGVVVR